MLLSLQCLEAGGVSVLEVRDQSDSGVEVDHACLTNRALCVLLCGVALRVVASAM